MDLIIGVLIGVIMVSIFYFFIIKDAMREIENLEDMVRRLKGMLDDQDDPD